MNPNTSPITSLADLFFKAKHSKDYEELAIHAARMLCSPYETVDIDEALKRLDARQTKTGFDTCKDITAKINTFIVDIIYQQTIRNNRPTPSPDSDNVYIRMAKEANAQQFYYANNMNNQYYISAQQYEQQMQRQRAMRREASYNNNNRSYYDEYIGEPYTRIDDSDYQDCTPENPCDDCREQQARRRRLMDDEENVI